MNPPVITIDGPTASGKGTVAERVAGLLGFHYLDSGALYRIVALGALRSGIELTDESALVAVASRCRIEFISGQVLLDGQDVAAQIRAEAVGNAASRIAVLHEVRAALLDRQRSFRQLPGLVTDGRDMGTVVFPDAALKIFLTASVETRAERRSKQLIEKGFSVNIASLLADLRQRDERDAGRANAPLRAAEDAIAVDSSQMSADQVVDFIVAAYVKANGAA